MGSDGMRKYGLIGHRKRGRKFEFDWNACFEWGYAPAFGDRHRRFAAKIPPTERCKEAEDESLKGRLNAFVSPYDRDKSIALARRQTCARLVCPHRM